MKDNNYKSIEKIIKFNVPKTYEQFLLEAQSEEETEENQKIVESYQNEYEAEALQGSQYGPGRKDFRDFCKKIRDSLRELVGATAFTGRISCSSDNYVPGNNYVGAIIYAVDGNFMWMNSGGDTAGRRGRSFYVIIKNTSILSPEARGSFGGGSFHGYVIHKALGLDMRNQNDRNRICAGGFAWMPQRNPDQPLRFNSGTLNGLTSNVCQSDGSSTLSYDEIEIIRYCWDQYASKGTGYTFEMPFMNNWVAGGGN